MVLPPGVEPRPLPSEGSTLSIELREPAPRSLLEPSKGVKEALQENRWSLYSRHNSSTVHTFLKFSLLTILALALSGCTLRDDIRGWMAEKTGEVVDQAKEQAKDEFKKQMNSAIDDVKKTAADFAKEKTEQAKQAVKDLTAEQLNKAREEGQKKIAEGLEKAAGTLKPTTKPTTKPSTPTGTFSYLNYTPETLVLAQTTPTFLFFYDENDATARAVDKYFTVTLDPVMKDINVLRVDATKDKSLQQRYGPKAPDELIQIDAKGKEIRRVRGEAYSQKPLLLEIEQILK